MLPKPSGRNPSCDRHHRIRAGDPYLMFSLLFRVSKLFLKIGIVVAGIAVVISYARLSEFGDLRAELMQSINDSYAGRISIDGEITLQPTFPPSVAMTDVRIRNADWATRKDMMTAQTMVAEMDLLPLLRGQMALPRLRMVGVDIVVERGRDGGTNWDELNGFETAAGPANPAAGPVIFPQIGSATLSVAQATLSIVDPVSSATTVLSLGGNVIEVVGIAGELIPCP